MYAITQDVTATSPSASVAYRHRNTTENNICNVQICFLSTKHALKKVTQKSKAALKWNYETEEVNDIKLYKQHLTWIVILFLCKQRKCCNYHSVFKWSRWDLRKILFVMHYSMGRAQMGLLNVNSDSAENLTLHFTQSRRVFWSKRIYNIFCWGTGSGTSTGRKLLSSTKVYIHNWAIYE